METDLSEWLEDKPWNWGQALALRAALRAVPGLFAPDIEPDWLRLNGPLIFFSLFLGHSCSTIPVKGHKKTALEIANLIANRNEPPSRGDQFIYACHHLLNNIAATPKIEKITESVESITASVRFDIGNERISSDFISSSIEHDCNQLTRMRPSGRIYTANKLIGVSLVQSEFVHAWRDVVEDARTRSRSVSPSFQFWFDWFERVIGDRAGRFYGSGGFPKEISRGAVEELIQSFDLGLVSGSIDSTVGRINGIIESNRANEELKHIDVPRQNTNAISFERSSLGKIALRAADSKNIAFENQDSVARLEEAIYLAKEALENCKRSNAGSRIVAMIERYLDVCDLQNNSCNASLLVQRGERLRQELGAYENPTNMLPPVSDEILLDLTAWRAAHNLLVGLDAKLMASDVILLGPDVPTAVIPPDEISAFARDADQAGILEEDVAEIVIEAAELAPRAPNIADRRTRWSVETTRNLVIEAFNLALRKPAAAGASLVVAGSAIVTLGPAGTVVGLATGAYPAASFLLRHRDWIEDRLGDYPTWRALFEDLCDWIETETPIR